MFKINDKILRGLEISIDELPSLAALKRQKFQFEIDFGLQSLPEGPGLVMIRGPRQYGKSTWLEGAFFESYAALGQASCYYLNGDDMENAEQLFNSCEALIAQMVTGGVRRLFIDEITSVEDWSIAVKRLWDKGISRDVLIVTTGSHAEDLLSGTERLPGRKGKLPRTQFVFTPISFRSFSAQIQNPGPNDWVAYLLSGGSPVAASSILESERIEPYVFEIVRDWILGSIARSGRTRSHALSLLHHLESRGATPVSMSKAAREAGLANNTVASSYIEIFQNCLFVHRSLPLDLQKNKAIPRKESKYPFVNLLGLLAFTKERLSSPKDFSNLARPKQGIYLEWLVAQELWRRHVIKGGEIDSAIPYIAHGSHEIDFFDGECAYEVKLGPASPEEFSWFRRAFPGTPLRVICSHPFKTGWCTGVTVSDFLLDDRH